jgi:hypothetical protein
MVLMELLRIARLGDSDRTSGRFWYVSRSEIRASYGGDFRSDATIYFGGSNALIRDSQDQFTKAQCLLGNRPRPANAK